MLRSVLAVVVLGVVLPGQVDFDCQGPACGNVFPMPLGSAVGCEGISWNGNGLASVGTGDGNGMPTTGMQHLELRGNGPEASSPAGVPFTGFTTAAEIWIPIPFGASSVSLGWNAYLPDGFQGPNPMWNDGVQIDAIDQANGAQLGVVLYIDSSATGSGTIINPNCPGPSGNEVAPGGLKRLNAVALPFGATHLRCAAWNGGDNEAAPILVVDEVRFSAPLAFDHDLMCSTTPGGVNLLLNIQAGTPNATSFLAAAIQNPSMQPAGWFYGVELTFAELQAEITHPFFVGPLDNFGFASRNLPLIGLNCPIGITVDSVVVEFRPGTLVPIRATPPRTTRL